MFTNTNSQRKGFRPYQPPTKAELGKLEILFQRYWLSQGVHVIRR